MKPAPFEYSRPTTLRDALAAMAVCADAVVLAGGQSLLPMLNLRVLSPALIIDIGRLDELRGIRLQSGCLRIGALETYSDIEANDLVEAHAPLLATALKYVAHKAIRNRGTIGGSLSLADPQAEMPACLVALDAIIILESQLGGTRRVLARDFFQGIYTTARQDDELIVAVEIRSMPERAHWFGEVSRRKGDFASAGLILHGRYDDHHFADLIVCGFAIDDRPIMLHGIADIICSSAFTPDLLAQADAELARLISPDDSLHYSGRARTKLMRTLLARGLNGMAQGYTEVIDA